MVRTYTRKLCYIKRRLRKTNNISMDERSTIGEFDISGDSEIALQERLEQLLNETKYVTFYKAMTKNDYKVLRGSPEDYGMLMEEWQKQMAIKHSSVEKQLQEIEFDLTYLTNCLLIIPVLGVDEAELAELERLDVEIDPNIKILCDNIQKIVNRLYSKYQLLSGELPKIPAMVKTTGEDMIAELSMSIEMSLPFDLNVQGYLSYHKAARKRSEQLKAITKKKH